MKYLAGIKKNELTLTPLKRYLQYELKKVICKVISHLCLGEKKTRQQFVGNLFVYIRMLLEKVVEGLYVINIVWLR